jgi:N-acyl homoserine lactone hydrolase
MASEGAIRVKGFVSGRLTAAAGFVREGDGFETELVAPVPCYLIETGGHRILFDTGLHPEAGVERYGELVSHLKFDLPEAPPEVDPTLIVLSHMHFDHIGGVYAYPGVPVMVQRAEWEAATQIENLEETLYRPIDYDELIEHPQLVDGDHDVLGDGRILLHPLPGHSPGSQALIINFGGDRTAMLVADACYFPENVDLEVTPPYGWDRARELESLRWLREQRDRGVEIVYGHDSTAGTFTV